MIRVILADDHEVVRRGIRSFLEDDPEIEVVAEANDGAEALTSISTHQPDVAILDIQMPVFSGIEVARQVRAGGSRIGLLILTAFDDDPYLVAAIDAGVNGFVLKTTDSVDIVQAVRDVYEGKSVLDPLVAEKAQIALASGVEIGSAGDILTAREIEVLADAARGLTNKAIAFRLKISDRTVQGHLRNAYEKLGAGNRTEAVMKAVQLGLISMPE